MTTTKVALLASAAQQRKQLKKLLEKNGIEIVVNEAASEGYLKKLAASQAKVLLISISDDDDDNGIVDSITENTEIPILFNDSSTADNSNADSSVAWIRKLAEKLIDMAANKDTIAFEHELPHPVARRPPRAVAITPTLSPVMDFTPMARANHKIDFETNSTDNGSTQHLPRNRNLPELNVWVLGASLGGPQAVRQFLAAIDADLPVAFILAQHIGANHVTLLAEQLNRVTKLSVVAGRTGHKLQHNEVVLTPADKQLNITADGFLSFQPAPPSAVYSPSIDNVMAEVAKHFGKNAGTIVFSGMGDDGAKGCEMMAKNGGIVWAQDIASCVVSSMPDHARKTGTVSFSAKPEDLAQQLFKHYCH